MEDALRLSTEQKLQQRLSPLQVKFVKILEMNGPEVEDEVQRVLDDNPALEIADTATPGSEDDFTETAEQIQEADYLNEDEIPFYRLHANNHSVNDRYYEPEAVDPAMTQIESLTNQISELNLSDRDNEIARYIIGNLDDNGYLTRDSASMAYDIESHTGLPVTTAEVRAVLDKVRSLEPAGIGAVDLRDCLLLQLKRLPLSPAVEAATEIVTHYFDLFSRKHYDRLKAALGIDEKALREAIAVITSLNPKPAGAFATDSADDRMRHIVPDFNVEVDDNGAITLTLLNNIPELQIESTFREVPGERHTADAELFLRRKREEANEFMQLLQMRATTLYRVMKAIVTLQHDFFTNGDDDSLIKPMILKDVARLTGYDLSVISRAAAGKYVATAYGIYPLKHFFNEGTKDDEITSSHAVTAALRSIIDNEDKRHPLSDEAITAALIAQGYDIARRTVAKYREKLGIPVGRLRREI